MPWGIGRRIGSSSGLQSWANEELRFSGDRILFDSDPDAVHLIDCFLGQHFAWRSVAVDFSFAEHHQTGKEQRREVEIMQRGDDGHVALAVESAQKLEDLNLMFEIEIGQG